MLRNGQGVPRAAVTDSSATAATGADTRALVESLLTKIANTDRGAAMTEEQKAEAARLIAQLEKVGTKDPLKDPRIFGDWEVVYSSNPTSSGGSFRSTLGRTVLKTRDMVQAVKEPNVVGNQVAFNALGVIPGEVTLEGTLTTDDYIWADVKFKRPTFKLGPFSFSFGGDSSVRLATTYLDERIRLGKGSRGSSFVFKRK
ncbi:hypothetical protein KFL_000160320 [Klebsormidium nitens]|uniref:Plastid lipid-associated protein/fibrillin conserved domain-containing protein n=1 Tax=Klebsormidium nitens TaxID=105231 RepID=A0A1Y1HN70_KLENI|nr:hypothetical protein KFL_000160320 [Klebsormidium nitens]|eukprot:GAQ78629.1 hypothetical protein KFL_000160320 [Klebsormidium nitens]